MRRRTGSLVAIGITIFLLVMAWDLVYSLLGAEWALDRGSRKHDSP